MKAILRFVGWAIAIGILVLVIDAYGLSPPILYELYWPTSFSIQYAVTAQLVLLVQCWRRYPLESILPEQLKLRRQLIRAWMARIIVAEFIAVGIGLWLWIYAQEFTFAGIVAISLFSFCVFAFTNHPRIEYEPDRHIRGRRLIPWREAKERADALRSPSDPGFWFGAVRLPSHAATTHVSILGSTGSGKTISIRLLAQSFLSTISKGSDRRALVYDPKKDMVSIIAGIRCACPVKIMNPFDQRSASWDIAADCSSLAAAYQIAAIIIPEEKGHENTFFANASQKVLAGVLRALMTLAPGNWTLRDMVIACRNRKALHALLKRCKQTRSLVEEYLDQEPTASNIFSTLSSRISPYEFPAAAWFRSDQKFSATEFVSGEYVMIMGQDERFRSSLEPLNRCIFARVVQLILDRPDCDRRRNFFILDELREMGKIDSLTSLLNAGRSKGSAVVIGSQTLEGLEAAFGEREAQEILGQCAQKAFLRSESPKTANYGSDVFGDYEQWELKETQSTNSGKDGGTTNSTTEEIVKRRVVLPSQIMGIPLTDLQNGLGGFYLSPMVGNYHVRQYFKNFLDDILIPPDKSIPNFIPRPPEHEELPPWTMEDRLRLGLASSKPKDAGSGMRPTPATDGRSANNGHSGQHNRLRDLDVFGDASQDSN